MKKVWNVYKNDIKNIVTNYAALITIAALCILPSLYAWFNIAASWDPYAKEATSQIKIGVVNNDMGTELNGRELNMGNSIVEGLKNNDLMGWQFVNDDEAEKNLDKAINNKDTSKGKLTKEEAQPGRKVRHPKFGEGTIISAVKTSDDVKLTIAFDCQGIKNLMMSFAPLELL